MFLFNLNLHLARSYMGLDDYLSARIPYYTAERYLLEEDLLRRIDVTREHEEARVKAQMKARPVSLPKGGGKKPQGGQKGGSGVVTTHGLYDTRPPFRPLQG